MLVWTRLTRRLTSSEGSEAFRLRWYEITMAVTAATLAFFSLNQPHVLGNLPPGITHYLRLEFGLAIVLGYSSFHFYVTAQRKGSLAFWLLSIFLAFWTVMMLFAQFQSPFSAVPQMLLGIAMVMVLFENERNAVQENALAFSTLVVDPMRLLSAPDLVPSMQSILDRLVAPLPTNRAVICISERWRAVLPSVQIGFSPAFAANLAASGAGEYVCELAYRRGGFFTFKNVLEMAQPLPAFPDGRFEQLPHAPAPYHLP